MEKIGKKNDQRQFHTSGLFCKKAQEKLSQQGKFPDESNVFIKGEYILN